MKNLLVCSTIAVCSLSALPARSECVLAAQATRESTCVVMARDAVQGAWLSRAKLDELSKTSLEATDLRAQLGRYIELTRLHEEQIAVLGKADAERIEQARALESALRSAAMSEAQARADLEAERAKTDSAWRSPWLWLGVGAVLGGGVVVAITR